MTKPPEKFTAHISKYALSSGIQAQWVEYCGDGMVKEVKDSLPSYFHGEGKDWHRTREAAVLRAEEMRIKKISSLEKQIKKLKTMRFT